MTSTTSTNRKPSSPPARETASVGVVGARGHTGAELLRLIDRHPRLSLAFAASRTLAGRTIRDAVPETRFDGCFVEPTPKRTAANAADICVLALPNGLSSAYVEAIDAAVGRTALVVDLSADHRFDDTWVYGLPETNAVQLASARRIANPGCYATAMMLALSPLTGLLDGTPHLFGVSGCSGAGTTPSPRNDPARLKDNLLPYALTGHLHEREVSRHLGRPIRFAPHVAPFFRGITMTAMAQLSEPTDDASLCRQFTAFYAAHPMVHVTTDVPLVRDAANHMHATVGGFAADASDGRNVTIVSTLDNLLKGAASQAIQNINLACGFDAQEGLIP